MYIVRSKMTLATTISEINLYFKDNKFAFGAELQHKS